MATFEGTIEVKAPPPLVFAVATDTERWPEFFPMLTSVTVDPPGPLAVGTLIVDTYGSGDESVEIDYIVTELQPGRRIVIETTKYGLAIGMEISAAASARMAGATTLQLRMSASPTVWWGHAWTLLGLFSWPFERASLHKTLSKIRHAAEARNRGSDIGGGSG